MQQHAEQVDQRSKGAKEQRAPAHGRKHTEVRTSADTNGTVLAWAWKPLSLCTGHAVHFIWITATSRASHEQGKELLSS